MVSLPDVKQRFLDSQPLPTHVARKTTTFVRGEQSAWKPIVRQVGLALNDFYCALAASLGKSFNAEPNDSARYVASSNFEYRNSIAGGIKLAIMNG